MWEELRFTPQRSGTEVVPHYTYIHIQTLAGTRTHTSQSHALCTKHLAISQSSVMPPQTYIIIHSQHQLLQFTHSSKSLFHFIQIQFLCSCSMLQEDSQKHATDTTLVRNMLQTHQHNCSQCAESARTMSTQFCSRDKCHTPTDSLTTGPCLPQG